MKLRIELAIAYQDVHDPVFCAELAQAAAGVAPSYRENSKIAARLEGLHEERRKSCPR